ncbi:MAG TPA: response regulator [Candidatus Angelobacter sp.]
MSILLADDDVHLASFLCKSLESEGYAVHTALDEDSAVAELRRQNYKLIILDLNFGQTDGLKLLERLRAEGLATPVMVLSARSKVSDKIQSLNLGADDYVTKPFSFQELYARVQAVLRRKADPTLNILRVEDLELDPATRRVTRGNKEIKLSLKEFHLLHLLMRHAGNVVTRQQLLQDVWGAQPGTDSNLVDVYVNYLRKKIERLVVIKKGERRIREEDRLLHTIRGTGYRLGREAPVVKSFSEASRTIAESRINKAQAQKAPAFSLPAEPANGKQAPWRALVNSVVHDLAQPLTGVRCFLEIAALRRTNLSPSNSDFKTIEQQADRAIALAKTISAMLSETPIPTGPWVSLNSLLEEVFEDFTVVMQSGLLTLERQWDTSIEVTSNPVLRQLIVLLVGKLVGKNTQPLTLLTFASMKGSRCSLELRWRPSEGGAVQDCQNIFGNEMTYIEDMVRSIGGELVMESENAIVLALPAMHGEPQVVH